MTWMRQKPENETVANPKAAPSPTVTPTATATATATAAQPTPRVPAALPVVNVGKSVQIKGELTGNEDLVIEGSVEGHIRLAKHKLTIGANARIKAEVTAKTVLVLGEVTGNIVAEDMVDISASGSVQGDITAPRVSIADGARFNGAIDMLDEPAAAAARPANTKNERASEEKATVQERPKNDLAIAR